MIRKKRLKILVVGQLPPPYHGSTVMNDIFCNSLKEIGYDIAIVEKTFSQKMEEVEKISFKKILKIPIIGFSLIKKLLSFRPIVCFYFPSVKPPSVYVDLFYLSLIHLFKVPIILYFHGKGYKKLYNKSNLFLKLILTKILSSSYGGFVLGKSIVSDVNWFLPEDKIFIIPNCIRSNEIHFQKSNKGFIQILFLSNIVESKGPIEFLKMARTINNVNKDVKFVIAGSYGPSRFMLKIRQFIKNECLNDYVFLTGPVYGDEKEKLFIESDIFVFPTFYDLECFPLVILEAMNAGLPVISSNEGCISEIIKDGYNGYIIEPKNILEISEKTLNLIENEGLRKKMGLNGKELYDLKFSLAQYKNNLLNAEKFFLFSDLGNIASKKRS